MPLATRKKAKTPRSAPENPWVSPYQGTRTAAARAVRTNIRVFVQIRGGLGSLRVAADMRSCVGGGKGSVTYHAGPPTVGLASRVGVYPPKAMIHKLCTNFLLRFCLPPLASSRVPRHRPPAPMFPTRMTGRQ